jgi:flagellar biosynthesis/type III secretory pathway protein FliH
MRRQRLSPAEHKVGCLKRLAAADLAGKQQLILGRCVDAYLDLHGEDQRQFEELQSRKENQEVEAMAMTLLQRTEAQALRKGRQEGRREGRLEGRQQGRQEGEARLLLGQLERKFGPLPEAVRERVSGADSERLLRWGEDLLTAERLDGVFEG